MERERHRLISAGGETYLPFAESCIVKLKRLGLPYADQSFTLNGYSIKVRVEPGHEYINIGFGGEGGGCFIPMESGIIESPFMNYGSFIMENPVNFLPGIFHETFKTEAYNAAFTKLSTDGLHKTNPNKGSAGQLSGVVKRTKDFKGTLPTGTGSKAFAPRQIESVVDGQPVMVDDEWDMNLFMKKYTVANCPASVFTGRCRLYVQAMYGAPLYEANGTVRFYASLSDKTFQYQPVLAIPSIWKDKTAEQPANVELTTSSGVYLDPATGKHWLFGLEGNDYWNVYPLIADNCGEAARKFITASDNTLGAEDKQHLETYILSTCRPDRAKVQKAYWSSPAEPYGTSMGYGWHWNYSGTRCDKVNNVTKAAVEEDHTLSRVLIMESTHYSMTITKTDVSTSSPDDFQHVWSAAKEVVSGPSKWGVERGLYCIVAPNGEWLSKQTPYRLNSYSPPNYFAGSASFYVFYRGDAIQVCTVSVAYVAAVYDPYAFTSSDPNECRIMYPSGLRTMNLHTDGGSGFLEGMPDKRAYWTVTFSCGGYTSPVLYSGRVEYGWYRSVGASVAEGAEIYPYYSEVAVERPGEPFGFYFRTGQPIGPSWSHTWNMPFIECRARIYGGGQGGKAEVYHAARTKTWWGLAVIATPQWDSEALYMMTPTWYQEDDNSRGIGYIYPQMLSIEAPVDEFGGVGEMVYSSGWYDAWLLGEGSAGDPITPSNSFTDQTGDLKTLFCRTGTVSITGEYAARVQAAMASIWSVSADDMAYANLNTISGTTADGPVLAWSKTPNKKPDSALIPPQGAAETDYAVLVGWV